jgi:peptidoglycan hydrolase-like protein with peptidoglycan-binding domain
MKQFMFAAVASIALALPAMAQANDTHAAPSGNQAQMGSQAQNRIDPSQLSTRQIRQIQMSLNKKGFDTRHADGEWGPETQAALKNFQQKQNIQGDGHLNGQTLSALGVDVNVQTQQGSATTGSGAHESRTNGSAQNPGPMKDQSTGTMKHGTTGQSSSSMNRGSGRNADSAYGQGPASKPSVNNGH